MFFFKEKFIAIIFVFFGFTFSFLHAEDTVNPVLDFVGGQTGIPIEQLEQEAEIQQQDNQQEVGVVGRLVNFIANLFGFGDQQKSENDELAKNSELKCYPKDILIGEPVLTLFKCGLQTTPVLKFTLTSGTEKTIDFNQSIGSYVFDGVFGVKKVDMYCRYPNLPNDLKYLSPIKSCDLNVIDPVVSIDVDKMEVQLNEQVKITWSAENVLSCKLVSDDETQSNWQKSGTSGEVLSHDITKDTTFTLICDTKSLQVKNYVSVKVK